MRQIDKNRVTQSVIVAVATLSAATALSGLRSILFESGGWVKPTISFFVWLVFLSLTWLLSRSKPLLLITIAAMLVSFLVVFGFSWLNLATTVIVMVLFAWGSLEAVKEQKLRIKFRPSKILRGGLPYVLTALSLLIAVAYYASPYSSIGENRIEIPREMFDNFINPILTTMTAQASPLLNVDEGMVIQMSDNIYGIVNKAINRYGSIYSEYLAVGLSIGIFLTVKTIGFVLMWLIIPLVWLIFNTLLKYKAVKLQVKSVLQEYIEI